MTIEEIVDLEVNKPEQYDSMFKEFKQTIKHWKEGIRWHYKSPGHEYSFDAIGTLKKNKEVGDRAIKSLFFTYLRKL